MCSSRHRSLLRLNKKVDATNEELINLSLNTAKRSDLESLESRLERVGAL